MCCQRFFTGRGQLQLAAVESADDPAAVDKGGQQRGAQCATEVRAAFAPVQAAAGEAAAGGGGGAIDAQPRQRGLTGVA